MRSMQDPEYQRSWKQNLRTADIEKLIKEKYHETDFCGDPGAFAGAGPVRMLETRPAAADRAAADLASHTGTDPAACTGCGMCQRACPADAISGERKEAHVIDPAKCIACGSCREACHFDAVLTERRPS